MSTRSEVTTQMIYGDSFSIIKKKNNWFKIKIKEDGYVGFVKKRNYHNYKKPSHKVSVIFAKTYKEPNFRNLSGKLTFGAKIKSVNKINGFIKFDNKWINLKESGMSEPEIAIFTRLAATKVGATTKSNIVRHNYPLFHTKLIP